jgi:hypothetical protein
VKDGDVNAQRVLDGFRTMAPSSSERRRKTAARHDQEVTTQRDDSEQHAIPVGTFLFSDKTEDFDEACDVWKH